ncbi:hypothetical protein BVRB_3g057610 [Beta vulgaris subsp. vulgaris]|nr:hypothetical protein BVRB_3g057610 [Beta vulgaris subsp. vulgaris]
MEKVTFNFRGHPFCQTTVKSYCLKWGGIILPMNFAKENDLANKWCDITLIDQSGKAWQLQLRYTNRKWASVYIGGWSKFHLENGLKEGDHVVFELIAVGENPTMNFYKLG